MKILFHYYFNLSLIHVLPPDNCRPMLFNDNNGATNEGKTLDKHDTESPKEPVCEDPTEAAGSKMHGDEFV